MANETTLSGPPSLRSLASRVPSAVLFAAGIVLSAASGYRWGVALFAWVAPVPFLILAARATGWRARLVLLGAVFFATCLQIGKIVTEPVAWWAFLPFAIPSALVLWLLVLGWASVRRRLGETAALFAYPAAVAIAEWSGYGLSELGTWGSGASMQTDSLPLLQLASLVGIPGIGFLMALVASGLALLLVADEPARHRRAFAAIVAAVALTLVFGSVRLFGALPERTITVGAVTTDVGMGTKGLPGREELAENTDELFERSARAADRGARIVVWNEAATLVDRADERAFLERGKRFARERGVDLVLAYGVQLPSDGFFFENTYAWIGSEGEILEQYEKHHPVPGEPSRRGTQPLRVLDRPYGKVAGAICYDYDFPSMAVAHARLGAELVVVPSSDWRGIDPFHTEIARTRAIEGGFSVVRPVRWASSAAFDAHGRVRAWMSRDDADHVMIATVPIGRVPTLYARIGDAPVALAAVFLLAVVVQMLRRRTRRAGGSQDSQMTGLRASYQPSTMGP